MKTYYIVQHQNEDGVDYWLAYGRGIFSTMNIWDCWNAVCGTYSFESPDDCEEKLRRALNPVKPIVIRVVKI